MWNSRFPMLAFTKQDELTLINPLNAVDINFYLTSYCLDNFFVFDIKPGFLKHISYKPLKVLPISRQSARYQFNYFSLRAGQEMLRF